jgi:hypothetical protein
MRVWNDNGLESDRLATLNPARRAVGQGWCLATDPCLGVAREKLLNLVLAVVQTVDDRRLRCIPAGPEPSTLPPRLMLALLTCCYAMGTYRSEAIAEKICEDPALQYFSAGRRPTAREIRRFRNQHRELIAQCLETVCLGTWKIRLSTGHVGNAPRNGSSWSGRFDPLIQIEIKCEVMERLFRAEVEDSRCRTETAVAA